MNLFSADCYGDCRNEIKKRVSAIKDSENMSNGEHCVLDSDHGKYASSTVLDRSVPV